MNISSDSRAALHAIIDIALSTPNDVASIFVSTSPHCGVVNVDVHTGGWKRGQPPDLQLYIAESSEISTAELALERLQSHLSAENLARFSAEKKAARLETLRQQLAEAEAAK